MSPDLTPTPGAGQGQTRMLHRVYLGWILSPGPKSSLLWPGQPRGSSEGLGGAVDHSPQREPQVGGAAHVGPGETEPCGGHGHVQDTLRLLPLQLSLLGTEEEEQETTVGCSSQPCLPAGHERM